jgi:hypothetical protein
MVVMAADLKGPQRGDDSTVLRTGDKVSTGDGLSRAWKSDLISVLILGRSLCANDESRTTLHEYVPATGGE